MHSMFGNAPAAADPAATTTAQAAVRKAIEWVKKNRVPGGGIVVHHLTKSTTPEVTGYLIPTLIKAGETSLAIDLAKWEMSVQRADGSFDAPDGVPYTFDTAQVIRGLLAVAPHIPAEAPIRRACDYVAGQIDAAGRVHSTSLEAWKMADGSTLTDYCNLYVLPPLAEAGRLLDEPRYEEAARRALAYFKSKPDLVTYKAESGTFSHMFGYMMEALVELGEVELAEQGLKQAERVQRDDGWIPAYPGASWTCSTGSAQLAIAWLKLGRREPAERALQFLERLQHASGGFFGSYGKGAIYFTKEEISWAVKFFLDAEFLRGA